MVCVPSCKYFKINFITVVTKIGVTIFGIFIKATLKSLIVKRRSTMFCNFTRRGTVGVYRCFGTAYPILKG